MLIVKTRPLGFPRLLLVWDNDKDAKESNPDENKRLLRLVGAKEEDWPAGVWAGHASFDCDLECMLRQELTADIFDGLLDEARSEFRMKKDQALKNPFVLRRIIMEAARQSHSSRTLMAIVEKTVELRQKKEEQE